MNTPRDIYTDQKRAEKERQRLIDSAQFMKSLPPSKWVPK